MRSIVLIILLTTLILTISLVTSESKAETATSGNLLPNAGDGRGSLQKSGSSLDNTNSGSGFTLNGISAHSGELEAQGTGTVSATGSLENITTTSQSGNSHTTTTTSLDGGVTLNATTEVQNCEWSGSSYRCGQAYGAAPDTYSTTIKILDENENVLASTSINRTNDAGYYNNTYTYTDTVTHNDTGARKWDWQWQGIDSQSPNSGGALGPNLLGASLTATLLDITYQPAPLLSTSQQTEITNATGLVEDAIEEIKFEEIENIKIEEVKIEEFKIEEIEIEEIKEIKMEEIAVVFEENFKKILKEENLVKEFETALIQENITEEEFFEEVGNMMKEELMLEEPPKETKMEESNVIATKPMEEETIKEEKIEEPKPEETNANNPNSNETTKSTDPEAIEENETSSEKPMESEQSTEETTSESSVGENTETERETETKTNEEGVDAEETGNAEETDVNVGVEKDVSSSISAKVEKIIKRLEQTLMSVDQKVRAVQFITLKAMNDSGPSLNNYANKSFYSSKQLPDGNIDFFNQLNIEQQQIYTDITLAEYTDNDPLTTRRVELDRIKTEENRLLLEIQQLREQL